MLKVFLGLFFIYIIWLVFDPFDNKQGNNYLKKRNLISNDQSEPVNENRQKALDIIKESKIKEKENKPHCSDLYGCVEEGADVRYRNASDYQRRCISTLGQGVYAGKSLTWKLDACNVP